MDSKFEVCTRKIKTLFKLAEHKVGTTRRQKKRLKRNKIP